MKSRRPTPTKVPGIPPVPKDVTPSVRQFLASLAEAVEVRLGRRGDPRDRAITLREMFSSGLAIETKQANFDPNNYNGSNTGFLPPTTFPDSDYPNVPANFSVNAAYEQVNLFWDFPRYRGHSHTEVWRHSSDILGDSQLVGISSGTTYIDPIGQSQTRYYWIRHVSTAGVVGPYNSSVGTVGTTASNVTQLLDDLTGAITSSELSTSLATPIGNLPPNTSSELSSLQTQINTLNTVDPWSSSTTYAIDELVTYSGNLYRSRTNSNTNNQPSGTTSDNTNWAFVGAYTSLSAAVAGNTSDITSLNFIDASSSSAAAQNIASLNTSVNGNTVSIQTNASSINGLEGQYSVKIDNNGHVSGFGLSSTTTTAGPTSAFIIRADKFAVIDPSDTGNNLTNSPSSDIVPFIIDGGTTFLRNAMIQNASITEAQIGSVNADTITAGTLNAARIGAGTITANKLSIDGSTLTSNNGVLQVGDINASAITAGSIAATVMSGTTVYANRLLGDVTSFQPFRNQANTTWSTSETTLIELTLPATSHLTEGHRPFATATGWFDPRGDRVYQLRMYMRNTVSQGSANIGTPVSSSSGFVADGLTYYYVVFSGDVTQNLSAGAVMTQGSKTEIVETSIYNSSTNQTSATYIGNAAFSTFSSVTATGSTSYAVVGSSRDRYENQYAASFSLSGSLNTATTSDVQMKVTVQRMNSAGTDSDTSSSEDTLGEISGIILGVK